jgi:ABC-type nitrate/sulfonate/bicarbonate transport system substrate-binding protein
MAGEIDYIAGVGPGSVAATLSGLPIRAVWFSANRISYWVMAAPQFKSIQDLKGKKIGITGGIGGTNHVALLVALEKLGANSKDYTTGTLLRPEKGLPQSCRHRGPGGNARRRPDGPGQDDPK